MFLYLLFNIWLNHVIKQVCIFVWFQYEISLNFSLNLKSLTIAILGIVQIQVSRSTLGQVRSSQKDSTKLAGKRPVLPVRCWVPLYHPSSLFLCTYITSPTRSSNSYSVFGGYGTMHRNLNIYTEAINSLKQLTFLFLFSI